MKTLVGYILGVASVLWVGHNADAVRDALDNLFPEPEDGESES